MGFDDIFSTVITGAFALGAIKMMSDAMGKVTPFKY